MPTTGALQTLANSHDHYVETEHLELPEQSIFLTRLTEAVLQIPPFVQVHCFSATGLGVHGLLRSVSYSGIQVMLPASLPLGDVVQLTIANCSSVFAEVLYCVKRSGSYRVGMVFMSRHKPQISLGGMVVIKSLDEPFTLTRGSVLDVGNNRLSIFCKTMLAAGAWVRVETNGWMVFGLVEAVVPTSMVACCVDIHLEAALPAASTDLSQIGQPREENANSFQPGFVVKTGEYEEGRRPGSGQGANDWEDSLACC